MKLYKCIIINNCLKKCNTRALLKPIVETSRCIEHLKYYWHYIIFIFFNMKLFFYSRLYYIIQLCPGVVVTWFRLSLYCRIGFENFFRPKRLTNLETKHPRQVQMRPQ